MRSPHHFVLALIFCTFGGHRHRLDKRCVRRQCDGCEWWAPTGCPGRETCPDCGDERWAR